MFLQTTLLAFLTVKVALGATTTPPIKCSTVSGTKKVSPVPRSTTTTTASHVTTIASTVKATKTVTIPITITVTGTGTAYVTTTETRTFYPNNDIKDQTLTGPYEFIYWTQATTPCASPSVCTCSTQTAAAVIIPAPTSFLDIFDTVGTSPVKCGNAKRSISLSKRATATPKLVTSTKYPVSIKCTKSIIIDSTSTKITTVGTTTSTVRSTSTVTSQPYTSTYTDIEYVDGPSTCTSQGTQTYTVLTTTGYTTSTIYPSACYTTVTPTRHAACTGDVYFGPKQLGRNTPRGEWITKVISDPVSKGSYYDIVPAIRPEACCEACWNSPTCIASGWLGYYSEQCMLFRNAANATDATCSNTNGWFESNPGVAPYYYNPGPNTFVLSNGPCGQIRDIVLKP